MNLMDKYLDRLHDLPAKEPSKTIFQAHWNKMPDVIAATCIKTVGEIIDIGKWRQTAQNRKLEAEILNVNKKIVGKGNLINFQNAYKRCKVE